MNENGLPAGAFALLQQIWKDIPGTVAASALAGGANNRVFRVTAGCNEVLLKAYFYHDQDPRDRLGAEFAFTRFAWAHDISRVPKPYVCDRDHRLGLYEFIHGRRPDSNDVDQLAVDQAMNLLHDINEFRTAADAVDLPYASEACLSIEDYVASISLCCDRLCRLQPLDDVDTSAVDFATHDITELLATIVAKIRSKAKRSAILCKPLEPGDRCLSPSDFGFHNALVQDDGNFRFLDFEYAGWDDPAKMISDFFWQPAVPVGDMYFDAFMTGVLEDFSNRNLHYERIHLLRPLEGIKWCCILLNEFLPSGGKRRQFAGQSANVKRRTVQLERSRAMLHRVDELYSNTM